ncbi:MAG TPA: PEP-CTERM-box response regulator transcription factor [Gammaproteobacteria bacterium]|nr:PEP-CTERM-box response regulator transcription factor [Gammaproteobacteria bacterium]
MTDAARKLLIVEDDPGIQSQLRWCFEDYEVIAAVNRTEAVNELRRHEPSVVLQDLGLPPDDEGVSEGFATLRDILTLAPFTKVIVVTGHGDQSNAVRAVGMGAYDFYQKPVDVDTLQLIVQRAYHIHALEAENRRLAGALGSSPLDGVIAASDAMLKVCRTLEKVAPTNATTLLQGESGTGKEVFARAIHTLSPRADKAFVAINCAAIPETLLESELFGFEKGAFTGAVKQTPGKIEVADGGTLFLDEIGDMPLPLQAKLLRFLQERTLERIGGRAEIPVDVRVVCATNKNLQEGMSSGAFRNDLYYRISEITISIPPVRERGAGRIVLAQHLLNKFAGQLGRAIKGFTDDGHDAIETYEWPGNVREMENKIKAAVIMAEGKLVTAADLGLSVTAAAPSLNLRIVRQHAETQAIRQALTRAAGNISRSAELLGVTRPTLYDLMAKYGIRAESPEQASEALSASQK